MKRLKLLASRMLDVIYPPQCALCETPLRHGRSLCPSCTADFPRLQAPFCSVCGEPFPGAIDTTFSCPNCEQLELAFQFARPALVRDDRVLQLVHRLKYQREVHLGRELGMLAAESLEDPRFAVAMEQRWPLVPVPLHRRRLRHRYFNQAEEMARAISMRSGLPVWLALRRIRTTGTQTALGRKQRLGNLRDAFAWSSRAKTRLEQDPPLGVILVDDVLTTGSTLHECARLLRQSKIAQVAAITLMRG